MMNKTVTVQTISGAKVYAVHAETETHIFYMKPNGYLSSVLKSGE